MSQSSQGAGSATRFFTVREPVRMDLAFNGARFIISEFALATLLCLAIGGIELAIFFSRSHAAIHLESGIFFVSCMLNALTFLLLAIDTVRRHNRAHRSDYRGGQTLLYTLLAVILLLVPLVFPLLAMIQGNGQRSVERR